MCVKLLIIVAFIISILPGCISSPGELEYACYKTKHFTIYYDDRYFADHELVSIGEKKEYLLGYINTKLEVNFDDVIPVHLYYKETEYAYVYFGAMYESRDYVLNDDGHEIAHIVSFDKLGRSKCSFLLEGLAVMLEYKTEEYNVIEEYLSYQPSRFEKKSDSLDISAQIRENRFDYTYYSYRKAGAFLCYVANVYTMGKLKLFYSISCSVSSVELEKKFKDIFGVEIATAEDNFKKRYFPDTTSQTP